MNYTRYIPLGLFAAYSIKSLVLGTNGADAFMVFIFACLTASFEYRAEHKKLEKLEKDIALLEESISKHEKSFEDLKTHVAGLKIGQQMRVTNVR